jgi:hypothetical protein
MVALIDPAYVIALWHARIFHIKEGQETIKEEEGIKIISEKLYVACCKELERRQDNGNSKTVSH